MKARLRVFVSDAWWTLRFFGHAFMHHDFDDPRVQKLVREKLYG